MAYALALLLAGFGLGWLTAALVWCHEDGRRCRAKGGARHE